MIPEYLIIEEQRRRERESAYEPLPLHAPMPSSNLWQEREEEEKAPASERGAYSIDLNDFSVTRL